MLEIKDLHLCFNKDTINEKKALNGIDLTINDGDFITVIGTNGAGKSTLLNTIAGTYIQDSGSILIDNQDVSKLVMHLRAKFIGRVFQDPIKGTASDMWILENLALAKRRGKPKGLKCAISKHEKDEYFNLLKQFDLGLEDRLTTKVGQLSGGQRQALTLIMATLAKPKILLLDEHTAALDPKTAIKVLNCTKQIVQTNNLTTFMVTHNMKDAIEYGNRLIMMDNGKIILDIKGQDKKNLTVDLLLEKFQEVSGKQLLDESRLV